MLVLVAVVSSSSATSLRSNLVHTSSGQNFPTMAQFGGTLDLSKPFTQVEETSLISLEALQMKSSCSASSATERIYGSTPLVVLVVASGDIIGSQFTTVTELSATKKSDAAVKNFPMNMPSLETIVPNENIILTSVSAPGIFWIHYT